jgi:hypothetical protein
MVSIIRYEMTTTTHTKHVFHICIEIYSVTQHRSYRT